MNKTQLLLTMDNGFPGCDADASNPLARAISQLLKEGKPFSNLCMCFFKDTSATLRWLGVFVQSVGNRVIYFPGFINNFDQIQGFHGKDLRWHKPFDFDHISLEKNRSTWHVTSKHRKDHLGGPRTLSLGQSRVLWLGISVADAHMMRIVKQETKIVSDSPPSDSQRRLKAFFKAREGAKFPIVSINNDNPIQFNEWFLHFCLIVGPKNFSFYQGGELGFPHGSPYLATSFPEELTALPLRSHRLELSDKIDIQITVCCLPGKLKTPVTITSPSKPSTALNSDTP